MAPDAKKLFKIQIKVTFFLTGTDELTDMARWIFEITISSDNPSKVIFRGPEFMFNHDFQNQM